MAQPDPISSGPSVWEAAWGRGVGLGVCVGAAIWVLDSLLPLPSILVQLHFLLERGAVCRHQGSCSCGHVLLFSANQARACHSPHIVLACFQGLQQSRQRAGKACPLTLSPPETTPGLCPKESRGNWRMGIVSVCEGTWAENMPLGLGRHVPGLAPHSTTTLWSPHSMAGRPHLAYSTVMGHKRLSHVL